MTRSSGIESPKYVALADQIRAQIRSGKLQPGDRLATFAEMCAQHNVTPTTITNVYSLLKQERLIVCERGRGTFVAEQPRKTATGIIGVSNMVGMQHPYAARLMRGIITAASKIGVEPLLVDQASSRNLERVDGFLAHSSEGAKMLRRLPPGMPGVVMNYSVPDAVCVMADDRAGIAALMGHLLEQGHRRVAAIFDEHALQRLSAYRDALHSAGIEPSPRWVRSIGIDLARNYHYSQSGYEAVKRWVIEEDWNELDCTAIVTQNDDTARGVIEALRQTGKRVPEDVSVTGFDGTDLGNTFQPFLTTVQVPLEEIGSTAVEMLQKQVEGEDVRASTIMLPVSLKVGTSTAPPTIR